MTFETQWRAAFGACLPVGWRLRGRHGGRWLRCHALARAQRLATTEAERAVIVARANALGGALFSPEEPVWIVACQWDGASRAADLFVQMRGSALDSDAIDEVDCDVCADMDTWQAGKFDAEFRDIAADWRRRLWFAPATGRVLAPYDGGFDLIVGAEEDAFLEALRTGFGDWMSDREDGL